MPREKKVRLGNTFTAEEVDSACRLFEAISSGKTLADIRFIAGTVGVLGVRRKMIAMRETARAIAEGKVVHAKQLPHGERVRRAKIRQEVLERAAEQASAE